MICPIEQPIPPEINSQAARELLGVMERSFNTLQTIAARMLRNTREELTSHEQEFLQRFVDSMSDNSREVVLAALQGVIQLTARDAVSNA